MSEQGNCDSSHPSSSLSVDTRIIMPPCSTVLSKAKVSPTSCMKKPVREFYEAQNDLITKFSEIDFMLTLDARVASQRHCKFLTQAHLSPQTVAPLHPQTPLLTNDYTECLTSNFSSLKEGLNIGNTSDDQQHSWVITLCLVGNMVLFSITAFAAFTTGSLSILASALDSFLDLISGAVLFVTMLATKNNSLYEYPVGKNRMEPLGIIVFASIMATASLQILIESLQRLFSVQELIEVEMSTLCILVVVIVGKFSLWMVCRRYKDSPSIRTLSQEHRNDFLLNFFSCICMICTMIFSIPWLDSAGAILLSLYIINNWTLTGLENIRNLTGRSATPEELQLITYLVYHFHPSIEKIDTVRAYYSGNGLLVEVDIVLPPETSLRLAHDIGEELQIYLESMNVLEIERAFVHLDYEWQHQIEHQKRITYPA